VHPLRYDYALKALQKLTSKPQELVEKLVEKELLSKVTYKGEVFLLRAFRERQGTWVALEESLTAVNRVYDRSDRAGVAPIKRVFT